MEELIKQIEEQKLIKNQIIIGIVGVPGAGKTYFCQNILKQKYPNIKIIPMDGYHIYRNKLNEEGLKKRGAPYTFDYQRFKQDLIQMKIKYEGSFPSFEHHIKDPIENQIFITNKDQIIVVEGLYLFLNEWNMDNIFDIKVLIDRPFDVDNLAKRHLETGIVECLEKGKERALQNDLINSDYLLSHSNFNEVIKIK